MQFVDEYSQRLGFLTSLNREQIDRWAAPLPSSALHASAGDDPAVP